MQELIDYFTEKYGDTIVVSKLDTFNQLTTEPGKNRFAFLLHLSDTIGEDGFDDLVKNAPEIVHRAEKEFTLQLVKHDQPHLTEEDLQTIVIKKFISTKEFVLLSKLESQLAGININDLIFLDMLGDKHTALGNFSVEKLQKIGNETGRKFLKYTTKIFDDNDLAEYIEKNKINLDTYIVELANNNKPIIPLRFIDWQKFMSCR